MKEEALQPMVVNCAAYENGIRVGEIDLSDSHHIMANPNQFLWVGLHEPTEELMQCIQSKFDLHNLAIEDAHCAHQRPKIDFYGDVVFIVLRTLQLTTENHPEFGETHFFLGENFLISIRHGSMINYSQVRKKCESTPKLLSKGAGFALYAVMDFIIDQYFPVVHQMEQRLEELENRIFRQKLTIDTTEVIYNFKRDLVQIKLATSPLIEICNRLMRFDIEWISEDVRPYFRDVYEHVVRINEIVDTTRELLNTVLEANYSLISISQNDVSKKFAGWAAIISIPTMVAGFYGMNFRVIPEVEWAYGFYAVLLLTAVLCVIAYLLLRKIKWL